MYRCFTLTDPYRFHKDGIETGSFAEDYGFSGFACHPSQRMARGGGTYIGIPILYQFPHTGFVAQNTTLAYATGGIYSQYGHFFSQGRKEGTKSFDKGTFAYPWNSGYSNPYTFTAMGQALAYNFIGFLKMGTVGAFHQCNSSGQVGYIAV